VTKQRALPFRTLWLSAVLVASACAFPVLAEDIPAPDGWEPSGEAQAFASGELWKYINGAAELFESHGVRELSVRNLERSGTSVAVSIYEMASPLAAFGVYGVENSSGGTPIDAGTAAVLFAPYQALMLEGRFYVKVDVMEGELDAAAAHSLLEGLAQGLPGSGGLPEELRLLPAGGRNEGTLAYTAEGFLGLSELTRCVHANYALDGGGEATLFLMLPAEGRSVDDPWTSLPDAWSPAGEEGAVKVREIPYRGPVALTKTAGGLLGAAGLASRDELVAWLLQQARQQPD
jgi:hypothetical protein